ncbi:MAG TPA: thioredoxin [Bacteroidales bacterium]|nr:thioredoxin [Bacteroidales bacterium]
MKNLVIVVLFSTLGLLSFSTMNAQTKQSDVKSLTQSNFTSSIKSGLVLVDFYADWCGPCKMMKPVLEEVATEYKSKITIACLNTDSSPMLSQQYNITGIPCMILFENGKEVLRIVGYHNKQQLLAKLADYL